MLEIQEVEKLQVQLKESTRKLQDLVSVNRKLDADCCQLVTEKHALEMRLEAIKDASADDSTYVDTKVPYNNSNNELLLCRFTTLFDMLDAVLCCACCCTP